MITSELRITGHDGGRLEFAHDGTNLESDQKQIYSMMFMALRNFHEANPNCILDHKVIMHRGAQKIRTQEEWKAMTNGCDDCTPEAICSIHDQISVLINLETLPSESV